MAFKKDFVDWRKRNQLNSFLKHRTHLLIEILLGAKNICEKEELDQWSPCSMQLSESFPTWSSGQRTTEENHHHLGTRMAKQPPWPSRGDCSPGPNRGAGARGRQTMPTREGTLGVRCGLIRMLFKDFSLFVFVFKFTSLSKWWKQMFFTPQLLI